MIIYTRHCPDKPLGVCVPHNLSRPIDATSKCVICVSIYAYGHPGGSDNCALCITHLFTFLHCTFTFLHCTFSFCLSSFRALYPMLCVSELPIHDCSFISPFIVLSNPGYYGNTLLVAT